MGYDPTLPLDALQRSAHYDGYPSAVVIPKGSRVRIHAFSSSYSGVARFYVGEEGIVIGRPAIHDKSTGPELPVRFCTVRNEWDKLDNGKWFRVADLEVLEAGDGTVTPGSSYPLSQLEIHEQRFAALDKKHQGYANFPTFLAFMHLDQEQRHVAEIRRMVRKDGTINPRRLETYYDRNCKPGVDRELHYPSGFPERSEFYMPIDWQELAGEFKAAFEENNARAA